MKPHAAERRYLERQITVARPIFLALSLVVLLRSTPAERGHYSVLFVAIYLGLAGLIALLQCFPNTNDVRLPLEADVAALGGILALSPSAVAFWFPFLFLEFGAGIRWGLRWSTLLAGIAAAAVVLRAAMSAPIAWPDALTWLPLAAGTFAAGAGLGFVGERERRQSDENEFLAHIGSHLQVEHGVAESLRLVLEELAHAFHCGKAALAFRDDDLDRIFVWSAAAGGPERISPENLPSSAADGYFLDCLETSVCWNRMEGSGKGFGWDRRDGQRIRELPRMPGPSRQELGLNSVLTASFDFGGKPVGRVLLGNARRSHRPRDLRWLERILRYLGPPLENLFLLRHLRARAIEAERSRISRDLHDGILQTLLSVEIQLDVLRRKLPSAPEQVSGGLATLQQTVRNESGELRRMVTDLRPLRVQSADLVDLMSGFAERFRNEAGMALDLLIDAADFQAPDRVCRELFQIYREALHNVKKHAKATHVVVKLWQNESHVVLVVDDNGEGFSFAGRFTGDELDRLRLGPISIKERARSVGGILTVESSPGHGSRLTVELPLS